ncbi:putative monooxygenase FAD-binding protein [Neofusicoccum parvum]|uniref:Monooxygenase FAD-binding protein n=1 Tax=Neofusicoccum parvum TaxID=310453 RepID=A0ACB5SMB9_9PEZI|nr:putative monooxygenase FAD-binding protein [Neofusicoccum parvum]
MQSPSDKKTQVIIVGGGVTGLTLALMLERLQVSYVLLEAYPSLYKPVGTIIGLFPNGLRILDQLGVLEEIEATGQRTRNHRIVDGNTGRCLVCFSVERDLRERHGYGIVSVPRHDLLQILERHLQAKDCLLTGKRVTRVEDRESGVDVRCEDGTQYSGQIVIGADGIHSTVREEIQRLTRETHPEEAEPDTMRCEYACLFAATPPVPHLFSPGDVASAQRRSSNAAIMCGRAGELYLFYYWRLPSSPHPITSATIPHISASEQQRRWAEASTLRLSATSTVGDAVAAGLQRAGATALPHHVFARWHRGRALVAGDAAHKFNPLMGQGGNSAIETAAAIANALRRALAADLRSPEWPRKAVVAAFAAVEEQRRPRVRRLVERSQRAQYAAAWRSWRYEWLVKCVMPRLGARRHADRYSSYLVGGLRLEGELWGGPGRAHSVPWEDERRRRTIGRSALAGAVFVALVAAVWLGRNMIQAAGGLLCFQRYSVMMQL